MKFIDLLRMCVQNLFKRIGRTIMTASGVTIGTASVIVMLSLGIGLRVAFDSFISGMGDLTTIYVYPGFGGGGMSVAMSIDDKPVLIEQKDIQKILAMEHVAGVKAVATLPSNYAFIHCGDYYYQGQIMIVDLSNFSQFGYTAEQGSIDGIEPRDDTKIIFGAQAIYNFVPYDKDDSADFAGYYNDDGTMKPPPFDLFTEEIDISFIENKKPSEDSESRDTYNIQELIEDTEYMKANANPLTVVAKLKEDPTDYMSSWAVYIDISLAEELVELAEDAYEFDEEFNMYSYQDIEVKVDEVENVLVVQDELTNEGFMAFSMEEQRKQFEGIAFMIQAVLGGLAGISLFVAAIGISNTMVMAITERTKEIGVMKVLGCELKNIRALFLMEAGAIGLLGGTVGVGLSFGISNVINFIVLQMSMGQGGGMDMNPLLSTGVISIIPVWLVIFALLFSIMIGLVSGFSPANKAVKISPLEAIRHD